MSSLSNIIIVGASGNLGRVLLPVLSAEKAFTVSVLTRESSTTTFPSGITVHKVPDSYPESALVEAFKGQDVVISVLAFAQLSQQKTLVDAALKAGVKRFVPSEFGADLWNDKAAELIPIFYYPKRETIEYLKSKEKEGLTWTKFATGAFWEMDQALGLMGFDIPNRKATIHRQGTSSWSTTKIGTIALAVKNAVLAPEASANRSYFINSFVASYEELLTAYEKATGQKWEVHYVDAEEQTKLGHEAMAKGDVWGALPLLIRSLFSTKGYGADYAEYKELDNEELGLPKESLEEAVRELVKA